MDIQIEVVSPTQKSVTITYPKDTISDELSKEYQKFQKKVSIKGFRKGKAPIQMIKKFYDDSVKYELLNRLINDGIETAVKDNKLVYVGDPVIKDVSDISIDNDLKINAEFYNIEEFQLKNYKGLDIDVEKPNITDEMFQNNIKYIQERFLYYEDVEDENTPIEDGFQVIADIDAYIDGDKSSDLSKNEYILTIGQNHYLEGFDHYFVGLHKNDSTEVSHPAIVGGESRDVKFIINVKWIKKPVLPEINEDFIAQFGDKYKSVEDFKEQLRSEMEKNIEKETRDVAISKALDKIRGENPFEIPQFIVEKQVEEIKKSAHKNLNEDEESFNKRLTEIAVNQLKNTVLLQKIRDIENITLDREDIEAEYENLSKMFNIAKETIVDYYSKNEKLVSDMINKVLFRKIASFIIDNSNINYIQFENKAAQE